MTDTDSAYLAGLIDGEGCISVSRTNTNKSAKGCKRGFAYRASLVVAMTNGPILAWCQSTTGLGKICQKKTYSTNHKPAWSWAVWSIEAADLCRQMLPYLKIKATQARLLIEFQDSMRFPGKHGLTDAEWNLRETIWTRFREENKRGVS